MEFSELVPEFFAIDNVSDGHWLAGVMLNVLTWVYVSVWFSFTPAKKRGCSCA